jgi:spermidine synthase
VGVFATAASTLMLEILFTRISSVISWYHLAFFVISLAMLGMTAGAVWVFVRPERFTPERVPSQLARWSLAYAATIPLATVLALALPLNAVRSFMDFVGLLAFGGVLAVPFCAGGVVLALALTRSPLPTSSVYGVDLVGAAVGAAAIVPVLSALDAGSAALVSAAVAALAALAFARAAGRRARAATTLALGLLVAAGANRTGDHTLATLRPAWVKGFYELPQSRAWVGWNSFSRVSVDATATAPPVQWAQSRKMPPALAAPLRQRWMLIDGAAGTVMAEDATDLERHQYLDWDVATFAHRLRPNGPAAVIGVGGGRDVIAAARAGHERVVGVELNPLILDLHRDHMADFSRLTELPGVELVSDEARSWLTRTDDQYRVITMSLIDTWASTGAGAYSLSENGLYTSEAWHDFAKRLEPNGVFTVSRWYHPKSPGETARMLVLALDVLHAGGAKHPQDHIFVVQNDHVATLLISRTPFSEADIDLMQAEATRMAFNMIATPRRAPSNPYLAEVWKPRDRDALRAWADAQDLDLSSPTDDRPFFFNMLRPSAWLERDVDVDALDVWFLGNLRATQTLVYATLVSAVLTLVAIGLPLWWRRRSAGGRDHTPAVARGDIIAAGTYFALIGLGFMFVEIGLLSRLGVFLGHPTLALVVLLAGIIGFTGLGSFLSALVPVDRGWVARYYPLIPTALVLAAAFGSSAAVQAFDASGTATRVIVGLALVGVPGLGLGLGFPLGLRLVAPLGDDPLRPSLGPWLWGINGACGVLASGLALGSSMSWGIAATLGVGAGCYAATLLCTRRLARHVAPPASV